MKKIIIVNNNMNVGGVQKSLCNLLWEIHDQYDVTLLLFRRAGIYAQQLPENVKVLESDGLFRFLGISQGECAGLSKLKRGFLALTAKLFGRPAAMKIVLAGEKTIPGNYDCAIAFLHNGNIKNFYGGVQEFVLNKVKASCKVAFLHCDYGNCGADHPSNNTLMEGFDRIAACSEGCRQAFISVLPHLAERTVTVRNFHRYEQIQNLADQDAVHYNTEKINVVMVSRLSHEKGIERAIAAAAVAVQQGIKLEIHIVGGGPMRERLEEAAKASAIADLVHFYGEQANPYRYMKYADLFLMSSFHEAAPMVIDEALCLNVPVLTVQTTSSHEMVTMRKGGWVCENTDEGLTQALVRILSDPMALEAVRNSLWESSQNNDVAVEQFTELIEG